jgi:hypothetical protein
MRAMSANAIAKPRIDERTQATTIFPANPENRRAARNAVRLGSSNANKVLSAKLVSDIEKTATDLRGITANMPTIMAKAGKANCDIISAKNDDNTKTRTQMIMVKSEKARHLLK